MDYQLPPQRLYTPLVEQEYVQKNWQDPKSFATREEAEVYAREHKGIISKGIDGRYVVLFVEEKNVRAK